MPTKHISAELMTTGGKDGGKHWTQAEVESRKAAADMVKRKDRVSLRAPEWLSAEALRIWNRTKKHAAGLDLLDNLDVEMLAIYCDAVAQYRAESKQLSIPWEEGAMDRSEKIKSIQSWARIVSSYAEKLGFTPSGRARLVKKRADEMADDKFGHEFD